MLTILAGAVCLRKKSIIIFTPTMTMTDEIYIDPTQKK